MAEMTKAEEEALGAAFAFEKLDVYKAAADFAERVNEYASHIDASGSHLANQIRRASSSIALNIAEGSQRISRPDKARFYTIASGSAAECMAALDLLFRMKHISFSEHSEGSVLVRRVSKMLFALIKSMK